MNSLNFDWSFTEWFLLAGSYHLKKRECWTLCGAILEPRAKSVIRPARGLHCEKCLDELMKVYGATR